MLQTRKIRENKAEYIKLLKIKNFDANNIFNLLIDLDDQRKEAQIKCDELLNKSNNLSSQIGKLYKTGDTNKVTSLKKESIIIKDESKIFLNKQNKLEREIKDLLVQIPNIPHPSVPAGKSDSDNLVLKQQGEAPALYDGAKPHWDLTERYGLIDFGLGNKITGSGFPVYTNKGAKLQRALISYFLDKNINAGYLEYLPPLLVNEASGFGTGSLPDKEGQMYHVNEDNLYLIPTAEVPVTNFFRDIIVNEFPVKCTAYTPCFRREAGSYGKDVRGLNRLHQFDKVEIVQIERPENSYDILNEMVEHVSSILDELELPYRILKLCGGDLSFTSALTFDFEVYSAGQKKWLEVSSVSNFEDYQSNRLKLRYKDSNGKNQFCHTLNGSALALPRIYAALIENNQTPDSIIIPKALQAYTGFDIIK
ncbi:MAG: serine--tRNA ligase [Flavobacteriales bacterium]|jgi:seryl-tRNA synthetase|nr:serine--tRNA ligase [Flavobacteriales bacterium]MBT7528875.1 serine--tRNA ligase [Flavobacteriaceae bacterium]MDC1069225.1 serine--tRNA ligase [Flavobacteriales bacterium]|tara:strand:+ start:533 stop:1798 length:1266 start_codon:yes stop_codon:yes gene_type:complete